MTIKLKYKINCYLRDLEIFVKLTGIPDYGGNTCVTSALIIN